MNTPNQIKKDSNKTLTIIIIITVIVIIIGWCFTYYTLIDDDDRGTYGDMFGSINALYSGLALAGIIFTILLQRKELSLQREELTATRKEFKQQNLTMSLQRFEHTFFSMCELYLKLVDNMSIGRSEGRQMLEQQISKAYSSFIVIHKGNQDIKRVKSLAAYEIESKLRGALDVIEPTFELLLETLRLIDDSNFGLDENSDQGIIEGQRIKYANRLRATISNIEKNWMFILCFFERHSEFKALIEKYSMFKGLRNSHVYHEAWEKHFFEPSAFGD